MSEEQHKPPLDDELIDYISLTKHLKEDTDRKKKQTFEEFEKMGEQYLEEIERKKMKKELKQLELVPYILKHCDNRYNEKELLLYSFEDIQNIYNEIKNERKSLITKFFHFIFNID